MARVRVDQAQLATLARSPQMRDLLERVSGKVEANAERLAPRGRSRGRSAQRGVVSQVVSTPAGWEGQVGHVRRLYGWHLARVELGTRYTRPQPHLRPAARIPVEP